MTDIYPEPPHLSIFVYAGSATPDIWSTCSDVLQANGCMPTGETLVAETGVDFKSVSDIERSVITLDPPDRSDPSDHVRLRSAYEHRALGRVSLGLAPVARLGSVHPIEVAVHAGALSFPVNTQTKDRRRAAKRLNTWAERLLLALASASEAPYGAIGIESVFPEPEQLADAAARRALRPFTWFWNHRLAAAHPKEERLLLGELPRERLRRDTAGYVLRAWTPGHPADDASIDKVLAFLDLASDRR